MALKSTFICPFCFEEHKVSDVQFRCTNRRCKDVEDIELTRYITAFAYDFIEKVAPRNGMEVKHYNNETEKFYQNEITDDYLVGTTHMTTTEMDIKQASSKAFSFMLHSSKFSPDRLVQIYDVAGESFVDNIENEEQLQYKYCQGIIFKRFMSIQLLADLSGTWNGSQGSVFELNEDGTCYYVDGGSGEGSWRVEIEEDKTMFYATPRSLGYEVYEIISNGSETTSILVKSNTSSWRDEEFIR